MNGACSQWEWGRCQVRKVLVAIVEAAPAERAVELACRLEHERGAELVLAHVIVVPYAMPLEAPMIEQEQQARVVMELGCKSAESHGFNTTTHVSRARSAAEGILHLAKQEEVNAIVLGVGAKPSLPGDWSDTSLEILHRAECEVIVDQVPQSLSSLLYREKGHDSRGRS